MKEAKNWLTMPQELMINYRVIMMSNKIFPPDPTAKKGFYDINIYLEAVKRYPNLVKLIENKSIENGEKTWLIYEDGREFTYKEVNDLSTSFFAGLKSLGINKDEKIAIFANNSPEWIISYFGILKAGAIPVTVNINFIKDPLIYNLEKSDTSHLIIDSKLLQAFIDVEDKLKNKIKNLIIIGDVEDKLKNKIKTQWMLYKDLLKSSNEKAVSNQKPYDIAAMILTSGTTGPSKVVADTHAQFIYTALDMIDAGGVTPNSNVYVYLPLYHIMALDLATISSMLANAKMVLVKTLYASRFWEDINKYNITHFHAVGPILEILFKQPKTDLEINHGQLIAIAYTSKVVWLEAVKRFNIYITGGYGSTEARIPVTSPYDEVIERKVPPGSSGKPAPPFEIDIVDEDGFSLPPNKVGEIVVRPKLPWAIFREYYNMPDKTIEAFKGLWFHTGDLGVFDENGYLYFVDRAKDAIRKKGENISSYEIEQTLLKFDKIKEAAVIPVPSEIGEDEVMAVISLKEKVNPEEIIDFCLENMPKFWVPRYIRFVDSLPRTPTGRIEKYKLRNQGITNDTVDMNLYIKQKLQSTRR